MHHQTIVGKPKNCLNRTCKHPFFKESHLGWLPKSEVEIYAVMRCLKCKDTFAVVQLISMAHDYKSSLHREPSMINSEKPITKNEIKNMQKKLDESDVLHSLMEGYKPGGTVLPDDNPE
jgi:hypothetical protein